MKLVINVDKYKIESCKRRKEEGWNEWQHDMILEGKPFNDELVKELEKIKAEIEDIRLSEENVDSNWCAGLKYVNNKIIDKYISELKGEDK